MKTLNLKFTMKTQDQLSAGTNPSDRGADSFLQNACACGRESAANQSRRVSRAVTSAATTLLCLVCLAPGNAVGALNYANETEVAGFVKQMLYWPDATNQAQRDLAAFRYKHLLYGEGSYVETNGAIVTTNTGVRAQSENMASLYGSANRSRSSEAEEHLRCGLTNHPASALLGNLLLDIYYDRTVAEAIFARQAVEDGESAHFGYPISSMDPPSSGFIIDNEITAYTNALQLNRTALDTYCRLLTNSLGVADGNPTPLGYRVFQELVPERGLEPASYTNASGQLVSVTGSPDLLFNGYKDLVLLYQLVGDYGRTAVKLAWLRVLRKGAGDLSQAEALVSEAQRCLFLHAQVLQSAFPGLDPEAAALQNSGLAAAIASVSDSLTELEGMKQCLRGTANPLGFAPDFLMLVENFYGVTNNFDSFDSFAMRLDIGRGSSVLLAAKTKLEDAGRLHDRYHGFEEQLQDHLEQSTEAYEERLFAIVGAYPGDLAYETPEANQGSEIWQQLKSIDVSRLRIERNGLEISNLTQEVKIEQERAGAVTNAVLKYANKQASITEQIGHINAVQAAADKLAEAANASTWWGGGAQVVNAAVQAGAEEWKGQLEAEKERNAGMEEAEVEGLDSAAQVKTLLLRGSTLAIDSMEAAVLSTQERGRLTALLREKADLERKLGEAEPALATRYFADPAHRLASQAAMVEADAFFAEARTWMYFMTRAFEYKWNESFTNNFVGRKWNSDSVFKVRNAEELVNLYDALIDQNDKINRGRQGENSWFSLREDHFGYKIGTNAQGQPLLYPHPITGGLVPALEAFRGQLWRNVRPVANGEDVVLEFSTARELYGENFFVGADFDTNGVVIPEQRGAYLDKIDGLFIRVPGAHTLGRADVPGTLTYGGTSLIRSKKVGTYYDPTRPDRLRNEMVAFSTRYWFYDSERLVWNYTDAFGNPVTLTLSTGPRIVPTTDEIVVFKERSVAATGWKLSIRLRRGTEHFLNIDEVTDIELYFKHSAISRQQ